MKHITNVKQIKLDHLYYVKDLDEEALYITTIDPNRGFVISRITEPSNFNHIAQVEKFKWLSSIPETDPKFDPSLAAFYEVGDIDSHPEYFV